MNAHTITFVNNAAPSTPTPEGESLLSTRCAHILITRVSDVAMVAEALSDINFRNFLADNLRKRVGKTGQWALKHPKFRKWLGEVRGILWGTGMRM